MHPTRRPFSVLAAMLISGMTASAHALVEMEDEQMSEVTGAGFAIVLNDIRITASPTSYLEFTGSDPSTTEFERGDIRWYGISITGTDTSVGSTWSGVCGPGILDLGCAQGGYVAQFAPHDNPLLLRVFDYDGTDVQGVPDQRRTVLELELPTEHEAYRFSFWGELNVDNGAGKLQVQNIWNNIQQGGSKFQIFQHSDVNDATFGLRYVNFFEADVRMSLNQTFFSPDTLAMVPEFEEYEGLYINDYRVFFPLGQLHYQSLIAQDSPLKDGNFVLEQTLVPNDPDAYNHFYGRTIDDDATGGYDRTESVRNALGSYHDTHAYVRMGDWVATQNYAHYSVSAGNPAAAGSYEGAGTCMEDRITCTQNNINGSVDGRDGLFFSSYAGGQFSNPTYAPRYTPDTDDGVAPPGGTSNMTSINLGDTQISGLLVHHMKITTCAGLATNAC